MKRRFLFIQLKPYPEIEDDAASDFIGESCTRFSAKASIALNDNCVKLVACHDKGVGYSCKSDGSLIHISAIDRAASVAAGHKVGVGIRRFAQRLRIYRRMQRESPTAVSGKGKGKCSATFNTASRPSIISYFIHCGSKIHLKL
jgi:hypothetical protein